MTRMETYCKNQKNTYRNFPNSNKLLFFLKKKKKSSYAVDFLGCDKFGFIGLALYIFSVAIETN